MYKKILHIIVCVSIAVSTASCLERGPSAPPATKEDFFDFNMEQEVVVEINYGFKNNYVVLFELYDQNPLEESETGSLVKKEVEPIYGAATNGKGEFSGKIKIPAAVTEVWLYCGYPGAISSVKLPIDQKRIGFDQATYGLRSKSALTRAATPGNRTYPDGWLILGDWSTVGTPDYLMSSTELPSASTLYTINKMFLTYSKTPLQERYPEYFGSTVSSDVRIVKSTKVRLAFINSTASMNNTVGYFVYPTDNPPASVSEVKRIIAIPAATPIEKNGGKGALKPGEQVELKYWDGSRFLDEFPAGVSIGWWLEPNAFVTDEKRPGEIGNIKPVGYAPCRYSLSHLNTDNTQRTVSLRDPQTDRIVAIAFEDKDDYNYNDAIFYLGVDQSGAIDPTTPSLPGTDNPPSDNENQRSFFGTLAFEDLWPSRGDYDMNDVMIDYHTTVYKRVNSNKVYKIEDTFVPRHNGGTLLSGFGYQLNYLQPSLIQKVTVEGGGEPSVYMNGAMLEPGQSYPTMLLFDRITPVLGNTLKVTIELSDVDESLISSPHNPFIFVGSDQRRGKEVHLVMYPPTDKADPSYFGSAQDGSSPGENIYYVSSDKDLQYPFALNIVGVKDFPTPKEGVAIDISYPRFRNWVESKGTQDRDWYK